MSRKKNTISIVIVTYNHQEFIEECISSCLLQSKDFPDLEIVVADDASTDSTSLIVRRLAHSYPEYINPVIADINSGIAANINRGLAAARGEFIAWLGGDDVLLDGKIIQQVRYLQNHPYASGCYHDAEVFSWPGGKITGLFSELYAGKAAKAKMIDARKMLDPRYQMLPSTVMVRRDCISTIYDTRLKFHNDYLFDLEMIIKGGPYIRMDGVYTRYRKHINSIGMASETRARMLEENLIVCAIAEARYPSLSRGIRRRAIYYISLEAIRSFGGGDRLRAKSLCKSLLFRGALLNSVMIFLFGKLLYRLSAPKYRNLAVKIRSVLS